MEPEGTDLQSAAFDHFAISPILVISKAKTIKSASDEYNNSILFLICEHFF